LKIWIKAFGGVGSSIQIDNNKSLKDLEDDYHKVFEFSLFTF